MKDIPVQIQPERRAHVQQHRPDRTATIIVHTKNDQQRAWNSLNNSLRQITDHKDSYIKSKVKKNQANREKQYTYGYILSLNLYFG